MAPSTVLSQSGGCMAGTSSARPRAKRAQPRASRVGRWAWLAFLGLAAHLACRERVGASLPGDDSGAPSSVLGGDRAAISGPEGGAGGDLGARSEGGASAEGGTSAQARPQPASG